MVRWVSVIVSEGGRRERNQRSMREGLADASGAAAAAAGADATAGALIG